MIIVKYLFVFNDFFLQTKLLQKSSKRDSMLKMNNDNGHVQFHYTESDYADIIRAYIDTVTSNCFLLICSYYQFHKKDERK